MTYKNLVFILIFIASMGFFLMNLRRILSYIMFGQKENRFDNPAKRVLNVLKIAFGQSKLLRDPVAGIIHFLIFWGFVLFLFAVIESIIQGFYSPFTLEFLGPVFSLITIIQDIFGIFVSVAVLSALYRRFIKKVARLDVGKEGNIDAAVILVLILGVVLSMFGQNISHIANNNFLLGEYEVRPVSNFLSSIFYSQSTLSSELFYEIFWWSHLLFIFGFMNFLPYSKHFHVVTSIPNVYFSKIGKEKYSLKKIDLEDENVSQYGAADFEHLSWKICLH